MPARTPVMTQREAIESILLLSIFIMSMTQEQINVDLFDQVKKLQDIKRRHEAEVLSMAQENDRLRDALEKYRGQIDNEGKHSAADSLDILL